MKNLGRSEDLKSTLDRLESLRPGTKALWGRMSVGQMLCHLCDSFRLPLGEKHASQERSSVPRFLMKWIALNFRFRGLGVIGRARKWSKGLAGRLDRLRSGSRAARPV
ncbi:MAG: hypothetical protein WKF37_03105 [Bryobacteraceae bacterium]